MPYRILLLVLRREKWWLAINCIGLIAFLYFASKTWREPELRGMEIATSGVAMVWGLSALPVLIVFFAINSVWLIMADRSRDWRPLMVALGVVALWIAAAMLDQLNH